MARVLSSLSLFIIGLTNVFAQSHTLSNTIVFDGADTLNAVLAKNGIKVTAENVIAFFLKDSLSIEQMQKNVDSISYGVEAVEAFIHAPLPWTVHQSTTTYTFYFRPDNFLSHASMTGYLSIPFWRIKNGTAPWLHELVHEMLNTKAGNWVHPGMSEAAAGRKMPLWLVEGLAEYIALAVSMQKGWPKYDPHSKSLATNVDSLFLVEMKQPKGLYVLSFIGKNGVIPELFSTDRRLYSPAFYHGSTSFVKYIAEQYGLSTLLSGIAAFANEQQTIERTIGKPLEVVKSEWLNYLRRLN